MIASFQTMLHRPPTKNLANFSQAKETQIRFVNFGGLAILLRKSTQLKTHGFASPVFTGFAFVGFQGAILA
jgi:hypothetical protein